MSPTEILMQLNLRFASSLSKARPANSTISQHLKENLGEKRYLERGVLENGGIIDDDQMFQMLRFRVVGVQGAVDVVCNMYRVI